MMRISFRQGFGIALGGLVIAALFLLTQRANAQEHVALVTHNQPATVQDVTAGFPKVSYQGQLLDPSTGQPVGNGVYNMIFRIYDASIGGNVLLQIPQSISIQNGSGLFSTLLEITNDKTIFNGSDRWLGVQVGNDPEATPRQPVAFTPYAIWAHNADHLADKAVDQFITTDSPRVPIAYGVVDENGNRVIGSNFNSSRRDDGVYVVAINGQSYEIDNFVTVVTPITQSLCPQPTIAGTNSFEGNLLVEMLNLNGQDIRCKFHFVVFKP